MTNTDPATYGGLEAIFKTCFKEAGQQTFDAAVEAAGEFAKAEMERLVEDIYFLLDEPDLTLRIVSADGAVVEFDHPVITLYDLILHYTGGSERNGIIYPDKSRMDAYISGLESLIAKLRDTKSWTGSFMDRPDDEPEPLTTNERELGYQDDAVMDDGRVDKPGMCPHYAVYVNENEMIYKSRAHAAAAFHRLMRDEKSLNVAIDLKCIDTSSNVGHRSVGEVVMATKPAGVMEVTLQRGYYMSQPNYDAYKSR